MAFNNRTLTIYQREDHPRCLGTRRIVPGRSRNITPQTPLYPLAQSLNVSCFYTSPLRVGWYPGRGSPCHHPSRGRQ